MRLGAIPYALRAILYKIKKGAQKMKVIAIVGPTAVGKSALAIELAKRYNGEIISCDSMQIYKKMDIGTAKPTKEEMAEIKHHLIDIKNPNEDFSSAEYSTLAKELIADIAGRGKTPIFCGGTGLYLDSVIQMPTLKSTERDEEYRAYLELYARENGAHALHLLLKEVDPESAAAIHENNIKRVIRALEIYKCTGKKKSELDSLSKQEKPPYDSTVIFLNCKNRDLLYERIEKRVDLMLENGLLDEARSLYEAGYLKEQYTSYGAIGYKELIPYFENKKSLSECVADLKIATRHYAKRQLTWFSRHKDYNTVYVDIENALNSAIQIIQGREPMDLRQEEIKNNYTRVINNINSVKSGREISLLAATKMQNVSDINYLISLGVKIIGENRVNELLEKYDSYDKSASVHFIGTLQKNKVKYIVDKVDLIHSVDSIPLIEEINKRAGKIDKKINILIEVNSGREENKSGILPEDVCDFYEKAITYPYINVMGLMTMAPRCQSREEYLKYFSLTKELFDKLFKNNDNAILSMGMSDSYTYAIEAGATMVRVGSKIFGERKY